MQTPLVIISTLLPRSRLHGNNQAYRKTEAVTEAHCLIPLTMIFLSTPPPICASLQCSTVQVEAVWEIPSVNISCLRPLSDWLPPVLCESVERLAFYSVCCLLL